MFDVCVSSWNAVPSTHVSFLMLPLSRFLPLGGLGLFFMLAFRWNSVECGCLPVFISTSLSARG